MWKASWLHRRCHLKMLTDGCLCILEAHLWAYGPGELIFHTPKNHCNYTKILNNEVSLSSNVFKRCRQNGKQCRPWSECFFKSTVILVYTVYLIVPVGKLRIITSATSWQNQQTECAPSDDSDQPGHPPSLIRVFAIRMKKAWALCLPLSAQRRLWSDRAAAQADLILHWAHTHFVGFVMSQLIYHSTYSHLHMGRVKRIWYLSLMRAAKVQASLRIRAVSPEPPPLAHTSSESRGAFRQKARSLAHLTGCTCAVKICNDGMLEDTNSLDGAHV